ncbi:alginate O-acetyltransferase AlgX-related protein [Paenibacillus sp. LPE1-1-1.1]|uniref:alginate O-acetyltransferase AlgX-related protein n=1 Tax=Paenibacillus sp. LPE1-1-1.1 TaxID=3135230 RepID=UPI0034133EF0
MLKKGFVIAFLLLMVFPSVQMFTGVIPLTDLNENRNKTGFPSFSFQKIFTGQYTKDLEAYINDSFGFRDVLVRMNSFIDIAVLHSSSNEKVVIGKNDYLFYSPTLTDYHRMTTASDEKIENFSNQLITLQKMLEKKGVYFLFVIGPNKNSIYPEYMPYKSQNPQGINNYDKLMKRLTNDGVNHLDLVPVLEKQKEKFDLYYKRDTHWNETAGFITTQEILKKVGPEFGMTFNPKIMSFNETMGGGWDLNIMLGINNPSSYKTKYKVPVIDYGETEKKLPATLWYHDSFGTVIKPHLTNYLEDLNYLYYVENRLNETLVNNLKGKKIVIYEVVERELPIIMDWDYKIDEFDYEENNAEFKAAILNLENLTSSFDVKTAGGDNGFMISTEGIDPRLYWKLPNEQRVNYISIKFKEAPKTSIGQIFWTTATDQVHDELKSQLFEMNPNNKEYIVKIDYPSAIDSIRIDLGMEVGLEYSVESISFLYD